MALVGQAGQFDGEAFVPGIFAPAGFERGARLVKTLKPRQRHAGAIIERRRRMGQTAPDRDRVRPFPGVIELPRVGYCGIMVHRECEEENSRDCGANHLACWGRASSVQRSAALQSFSKTPRSIFSSFRLAGSLMRTRFRAGSTPATTT